MQSQHYLTKSVHVNVLEDIVKNWKEEIVMEYYDDVNKNSTSEISDKLKCMI